MARKIKKFADGGSDKYQARYDRKVADIESDYQKWIKSGKYGNANVAKAKYEQRMADAKNDLAGWRGQDQTASRAAERASESTLSEARRTKGANIANRDAAESAIAKMGGDKPLTSGIKDSDLASLTEPSSFGAAFRQNRALLGPNKTFTWKGKSYSTNMAGEGAGKPAARSSSTPSRAATQQAPAKAQQAPAKAQQAPAKAQQAPAKAQQAPAKAQQAPAKADTSGISPWEKDAQGHYTDRYPNALQERGKDFFTLGLNSLTRGGGKSGSSAYDAMGAYYKNKAAAEAAAEAAAKKKDADELAARLAAGRKGMQAAIASGKPLEAPALLRKPGLKKGGAVKKPTVAKPVAKKPVVKKPVTKKLAVKKFAKGGSVDGCAIRGKTRAPMRRK